MGFELTLWVIAGIVLVLALGILSAETDSGLLSTATFICGIAILQLGMGVSIIASIMAAPVLAFVYVIAYFASGVAMTSLWSWPDFIRKNGDSIDRDYQRWEKSHADNDEQPELKFEAYLESSHYEFSARDHKERLATFVGMWPFKLIWDLSRRPAIWIFNTSWSTLGTFFQNIGKRTARKAHSRKR